MKRRQYLWNKKLSLEYYAAFTLIELIMTMALAAIILTLGVPSFQEIIRNNRLATIANDFIGSLHLTRSEAIKRGLRVTLCKSADGVACANSGGYEQGWLIFVDLNNNTVVEANEPIIRVFSAISSDRTTLTGNAPVARYISYVATGTTQLTSGSFQAGTVTLCDAPKARQIVINTTGRVRLEQTNCL